MEQSRSFKKAVEYDANNLSLEEALEILNSKVKNEDYFYTILAKKKGPFSREVTLFKCDLVEQGQHTKIEKKAVTVGKAIDVMKKVQELLNVK